MSATMSATTMLSRLFVVKSCQNIFIICKKISHWYFSGSFCPWYCVNCHQVHFAMWFWKSNRLEVKNWISLCLDKTFSTLRVLHTGGATPNTNILMQTCFFPNALHCNVGKGFPPEIQQLTQFQFSISFSYSVGLFPRRVNHRARAPGGHRGTPAVSTWWGSPFPFNGFYIIFF